MAAVSYAFFVLTGVVYYLLAGVTIEMSGWHTEDCRSTRLLLSGSNHPIAIARELLPNSPDSHQDCRLRRRSMHKSALRLLIQDVYNLEGFRIVGRQHSTWPASLWPGRSLSVL